jgi:hypothetical protein
VLSDSGIVYVEGRPYMIAVMIDYDAEWLWREWAIRVMREISQISYEYIISTQHGEN